MGEGTKLTRAELEQKQGKEFADAIIHYKHSCRKIYDEEVREHPDAPGSKALRVSANAMSKV